MTTLWSAHCVCTNTAALAKHHQITTRTTPQHNMKRNASFNPQMKHRLSLSNRPVQPRTWLLSTKKKRKKKHEALTLQSWNRQSSQYCVRQSVGKYSFMFICIPSSIYYLYKWPATCNTSSRLRLNNEALSQFTNRTKCVSCSSQLVKIKQASRHSDEFSPAASLSLVSHLF